MEFRAGRNVDEFEHQIAQYRDEFYRFIYRNVWDSSVADDVFSAAILAAYEGRAKYAPGSNFRAWMYRILLNKCFVANRETGRAFKSLDDESPAPAAAERRPSRDIVSDPKSFLEQCGDEVFAAFRRLSTAQRSCILLRDVERFSYREIADIMQVPVGTVMTHLARGRKKLREELLDYAVEAGVVRALPRVLPRPHDDDRRATGGTTRQ